MSYTDAEQMREHAIRCAKNFKTGWMELGQVLFTIWRDKHYKNWGFSTFEAYTGKEVNIRKLTALKLIRSYHFLEKEEPGYLKEEYVESSDAADIPNYEAIDVLRLAKNKKTLDSSDYAHLKKNVFKGKDSREVRKDLTTLMRQREELDPDEAWAKKRDTNLKRLLSTLKSLKNEIESSKILPQAVIKEVNGLIQKIESEVGKAAR